MSKVIAAAVLILLAASTAIAEPRYRVFGDSLCSEPDSWANQWNERGVAYVQAHCQAGRRMVDLDIPRDLVSRQGERAILALGANDAGSGVLLRLFKRHARTSLLFLSDRGFDPVVVLPPLYPFHYGRAVPYRDALVSLAAEFGLQVIDPEFPYGDTIDGVHPTRSGHGVLADSIASGLGIGF